MIRYGLASILVFLASCMECASSPTASALNSQVPALNYDAGEEPVAERRPVELITHDDLRIDDYFWLNQREDPAVIAYLEAENAYAEQIMESTSELRSNLYDEMRARYPESDDSAPYFFNGYYYYERYEAGLEYPIYARRRASIQADEEIMLNVNELAANHDYYHLRGLSVSPDNRFISFGIDTVGRRQYEILIKDLESGQYLPDRILNTNSQSVWAADSRTLFYAAKDPLTLRTDRVFRHQLGAELEEATEVYFEEDDTFYLSVTASKSKDYIFIESHSTLTSETRIVSSHEPGQEAQVFLPRQHDHLYTVTHDGEAFFVLSNWDAPNYRILTVDDPGQSRSEWRELIAHREDVFISDFDVFSGFLVLVERMHGINNLRIVSTSGPEVDYKLAHDEPAYNASLGVNPELNASNVRYVYTSMTTPHTEKDVALINGEQTIVKQSQVLGGFDPANYVTERLYARARDGKAVAISVVYRRGVVRDGSNPTLLYGYGSYGASIPPSFSANRVSLLDRGFIFAIAHVRGSQTFGKEWYEDGKLLNKRNTFYDFIDCAEFLIAQRYTNSQKLFANGASAGGLLMGAVINMRPELFRGVVAAVPFVDVVTTMLDDTIPLTTFEYDEWGNPNDPIYYHYMKSYSPYDNVTEQDYPALLVTSGLHDSQVQYWEPTKWVAKLRQLRTNREPLLLKTDMSAGHSGRTGRFSYLHDVAYDYAFLLSLAVN